MPYPAETSQHLDRVEKFLAPITPAVPDKGIEMVVKVQKLFGV